MVRKQINEHPVVHDYGLCVMVKTSQIGDLNAHANLVSKLVACHQHQRELVQCHNMCLLDIVTFGFPGLPHFCQWESDLGWLAGSDRVCDWCHVEDMQSMSTGPPGHGGRSGVCQGPQVRTVPGVHRDLFVYAPSQWETTLHCNAVSHWLSAYTKWSLGPVQYCISRNHSVYVPRQWETALYCNAISHWLDAYTEWPAHNIFYWRIKVSRVQDRCLELSNHSKIWLTSRQDCFQAASQSFKMKWAFQYPVYPQEQATGM